MIESIIKVNYCYTQLITYDHTHMKQSMKSCHYSSEISTISQKRDFSLYVYIVCDNDMSKNILSIEPSQKKKNTVLLLSIISAQIQQQY